MKSIDISGKTAEDAIKSGLRQLNADLAEVTIDVVDSGSPGLFGMFGRLAKVRMTLKEEAPDMEMPVFSLDQAPEKQQPKLKLNKQPQPEQPKAEQPRQEPKPRQEQPEQPKLQQERQELPKQEQRLRTEKPQMADGPNQQPDAPRQPSPPKPRQPRAPREPKPIDRTPIQVEWRELPPLVLEALSDAGKTAYEFLENVTKLMSVPVEIRIEETPDHMEVQMVGDSLGVLIGRRGDTLDALQYLTSLQVNKGRDKYIRVALDTEHYRAKRVEALTKLASRMASRAQKTGHRVALEPMNPYERRILHSALQGHPQVTTHSEGEEPYRRVVITMK